MIACSPHKCNTGARYKNLTVSIVIHFEICFISDRVRNMHSINQMLKSAIIRKPLHVVWGAQISHRRWPGRPFTFTISFRKDKRMDLSPTLVVAEVMSHKFLGSRNSKNEGKYWAV
jgi:hypothetical protein